VLKPVEFPRFYQTIQAVGRYWLATNLSAVASGPPATNGGWASGRRG
jgi:hypothetical protein